MSGMYILAIFSLLLTLSDDGWKEKLGEERFRVMRKGATEPSYSGHYLPSETYGVFHCAACEAPLFRTEDQYDAGNGWPNFTYPIEKQAVYYQEDWSFGFKRYQVLCRGCKSHLGHVFSDGPPPKKLRYCVNSICLKRKP